jgi:hypothetical protein
MIASMKKMFILAAALGFSSQAFAQSTTCMDLGGGLVTCDTVQPRGNVHTQCMRHGTIISCNSTGGTYQGTDQGAAAGAGLVALIQGINERKFNKRVGEMLAAGDCVAAANYAFEKGRLEIGQSIIDRCRSASAEPQDTRPTNLPYDELVPMIERAANTYVPGFVIGGDLVVNSFRADGGTLRLTTNLNPASDPASVTRLVCENPGMQAVLVHGGSIAIDLKRGSIDISRGDCAL